MRVLGAWIRERVDEALFGCDLERALYGKPTGDVLSRVRLKSQDRFPIVNWKNVPFDTWSETTRELLPSVSKASARGVPVSRLALGAWGCDEATLRRVLQVAGTYSPKPRLPLSVALLLNTRAAFWL